MPWIILAGLSMGFPPATAIGDTLPVRVHVPASSISAQSHKPGPMTTIVVEPIGAPKGAPSPDAFQIWGKTSAASLQQACDMPAPSGECAQASVTPESPSLGIHRDIAFLAGNIYAGFSADGGVSWTPLNAYDNFPADGVVDVPTGGGSIAGNQVVLYDASHDLTFWLLQYGVDGNGTNIHRLAVAHGRNGVLSNTWDVHDFSPVDFGKPADQFRLDFPDLQLSDNFLYYTSLIVPAGGSIASESVIVRIPLDELAAANVVTIEHQLGLPGLRCVSGAGDVMYFAGHLDNATVRIYRWSESEANPLSDDVTHPAFTAAPMSAIGPDGRNMAGGADNRILAAYRAKGELGFLWNCAQHDAFPFPHVEVSIYRESDRQYLRTETVWSNQFAMMYPSIHVNGRGDLGGTMVFGGGAHHPGVLAFIADDFNGRSLSPLENVVIEQGVSGPANDRWGNVFAARGNFIAPNSWNGTGYVMTGPQNDHAKPLSIWWGRERDRPPVDITVLNVAVNGGRCRATGEPITLSATLRNLGMTSATGVSVQFRISDDETIDGSDPLVVQQDNIFVGPNATRVAGGIGVVPVVPRGVYYLGATMTVAGDAVAENNASAWSYRLFIDAPPGPRVSADLDGDCDVDVDDFALFEVCRSGPAIAVSPECDEADFDRDGDADQGDFGRLQRCLSGAEVLADPACELD
mgnify:FL=1